MKAKFPVRFLLSFVTLILISSAASSLRAQDARSTLTNFPEAQAVLYINARRVINEAVPSVVPQAMLDKALADIRQVINLNDIDYVIAGARLKGVPSAKELPEFLLIMRGSFSAEALLSGARMMGTGMYVQETHGGKTISVFTLNKPAPAGAAATDQPADGDRKPAQNFPVDQIAATALDANTLAIGIPAYLRDAIDASAGGGQVARLKPELVDLALRDTNTLFSMVSEMPASASQYVRSMGAPPNPEMERMLDAVRQVQLSVNMLPATFGLNSIIRMDSSEQAQALSGLINMGAGLARAEMSKDAQKKSGGQKADMAALLQVLETFTNAARDNEVALGLTFQQARLAEVVKRQLAAQKTRARPPRKRPRRAAAAVARAENRTGLMNQGRYSEAEITEFAGAILRDGFCILPEHFPRETLDAWRAAFTPLLTEHIAREGHLRNRGAARYYVTLPFDAPFADPAVYEDPDVLAIVERLAGVDFTMVQLATDTPLLGSEYQEVHRDTPPLFPETGQETPPFQLAVNFPLVEVTPENGPFEVARGTHLLPKEDALRLIERGEINLEALTMRLGDVMVRDVRALHRGTPNRTNAPRPMVVIGYSRRWLFRP
jgi:hypothetical protein